MPTQNNRGIYDDWIAGEQLEAAPLDHNMRMIVSVSGNQTVNGVKTFGSIPVGPASNPTTDNQLTRKKYVDDQDALNVHLSGDQTIAGVKTFSSIPVLPASDPTSDNQASRKAYVDQRVKEYVEITPVLVYDNTNVTWVDWDLSASIPAGARYADVVIIHPGQGNASYPRGAGVRKNGSTIDRIIEFSAQTYNSFGHNMIVELDDNRIIERRIFSTQNGVYFYVVGYWK
jgi:hypothetical protein